MDAEDLRATITRVYVDTLYDYLNAKHGEQAQAIIEKFSNTGRDHVIVSAETPSGEVVEGFFMIPTLAGWSNSNLRRFITYNKLPSEVDTEVQEDLDTWVGREVGVVLQSVTMSDGSKAKFPRLAK